MKKTLTITLCSAILFAVQFSYALPVDKDKALQTAYGFYVSANPFSQKQTLGLESVIIDRCSQSGEIFFYAINFSDTGFVLIAGDDAINPVLAYSFSSNFTGNDIPVQLEGLLNEYRNLISHVRENNISQTQNVFDDWNKYVFGFEKQSRSAVGPLIPCQWDQSSHYNMLCPEDPDGPGGRVYAGCVATAMSMVMYHFRFPDSGQGQHGYHSNYGYLYVDYTQSQYNWNEMPTKLNAPNYPVAKLQYDAGVAVDMMYSPNGSGAYMDDAAYAMHTYFKYSPTLTLEYRDYYSFNDWTALLKSQIDMGYPLIYAGYGSAGPGHAFVCDGYDSGNLFHFNWGWSGSYNGFYVMDYLTPGGYNFSSWQMAVVNCFPNDPNYPSGCNGNTVITGSTGTFTDGSGPANYQSNSSCSWLIHPSVLSQSVTLKFHRFDIESSGDQVCVYDGSDSSYPLIGCYTGNTIPANISSGGESIFVTFQSDASNNDKGFFIEYFSTPMKFCEGYTILTAPSGTIEDGSGLHNYQPNTLCRWMINPDNAQAIVFEFEEFDTEANKDVVILLDNSTFPSTEIARFSGSQLPETFVYWGERVILMFKSDSFFQQGGWKINYSTWMTSTEEFVSENERIYPNPFNDIITIQGCDDGCEVKIFSASGSLLKTINTEQTNSEISTSDLPQGVYMIQLKKEDQIFVHKMVKIQ